MTYASGRRFQHAATAGSGGAGVDGGLARCSEERKGPRADAPAAALEGFLRSTGLTRDQLEMRDDKKGEVWFAVVEKPGRPAAAIVAEVLEATVRGNFPWPKSMRWGSGSLALGAAASFDCLPSE